MIGDLEARRCQALTKMVDMLKALYKDLIKGWEGCDQACKNMLLGQLTHSLETAGFLEIVLHQPVPAVSKLSYNDIKESLMKYEAPKWYSQDAVSGMVSLHSCSLRQDMLHVFVEADKIIDELPLQVFDENDVEGVSEDNE